MHYKCAKIRNTNLWAQKLQYQLPSADDSSRITSQDCTVKFRLQSKMAHNSESNGVTQSFRTSTVTIGQAVHCWRTEQGSVLAALQRNVSITFHNRRRELWAMQTQLYIHVSLRGSCTEHDPHLRRHESEWVTGDESPSLYPVSVRTQSFDSKTSPSQKPHSVTYGPRRMFASHFDHEMAPLSKCSSNITLVTGVQS